jgi:cysteine desulfuration protein SufE
MSLAKKEQEIIDEFSFIPDIYERFSFVVDRAKNLPPLADSEKIAPFAVDGCQAQLWIVPSFDDATGLWSFRSESDAPIVHSMAALFCQIYSGNTAADIASFEPTFLQRLELERHLTPNRRNGMNQIIEHLRACATGR